MGDYGLVFILERPSLALLQQHAPDLDHMLSAATWQFDRQMDNLSKQARAQRLEALQSQFGLTNEQVIQKAERGELPGDPAWRVAGPNRKG